MSGVKKSADPRVSTLAGAIAGGIETSAVWPMEYIKTQLQLEHTTQAGKAPRYTGVVSCARYTYTKHGITTFYRGILPVLIGSFPKAGIRFGGFNYLKEKLSDENGKITPVRTLAAGMAAGAVEATLAVTPYETLKTRLIDMNKGLVRGTVDIVRKEGLGGVYKGWAPTVAKQSSNQGLRFMAFGQYKEFMLDGEDRGLKPLEALAGGMVSGCFSTVCNNPMDMIKTRMQGIEAARYSGFADCITSVVKNEGIFALWKGTLPRLGRVVPGQGIIFMSYEMISNKIETLINN